MRHIVSLYDQNWEAWVPISRLVVGLRQQQKRIEIPKIRIIIHHHTTLKWGQSTMVLGDRD